VKSLPATLVSQKNKISSADPWILLLEVTIPEIDNPVLRLARNTEDVTFGGTLATPNVYTKFPFELDATKECSKGEIPSITLSVTNINQILQSYVEAYDGLVGQKVTLIVVNANYLDESYAELTLYFDIMACSLDSTWIKFSLGAPSPLNRRFPLYKYIATSCNWRSNFKGVECKYKGVDISCKGTLEDCLTKNNSMNFGGYPGLAGGGLRVA
jgi:phage-related protein